jgi:aryl-alcohol dehydrogenase-like predicted oxidoreductase
MGLTGAYNSPVDDEAGIAVITHAFSRGVTFFDTSDVYGPLTNEILLGKVRSHSPFSGEFLQSYGRELLLIRGRHRCLCCRR